MIRTHESDFLTPQIERAINDQRDFIINELGVSDQFTLNQMIEKGKGKWLIEACEKKHNSDIAGFACNIAQNAKTTRLILIAGPSSSGKTTFSSRLRYALQKFGIVCHILSTDDYFLSDNDAERKNGNVDWESINIVDTELFDSQLFDIVNGKTVEIPYFNFLTGQREWRGNTIQLEEKHIIVVEGIHGLNPRLTPSVPEDQKYRLYISPIPQLTIDSHEISPSYLRLIRRMVRDYNYRGADAHETLSRWESVRAGEVSNIFPYISEADCVFNSTLVYEIAALKNQAEMILSQLSEDSDYFGMVYTLRYLLNASEPISLDYIPDYSIIREFIGQ